MHGGVVAEAETVAPPVRTITTGMLGSSRYLRTEAAVGADCPPLGQLAPQLPHDADTLAFTPLPSTPAQAAAGAEQRFSPIDGAAPEAAASDMPWGATAPERARQRPSMAPAVAAAPAAPAAYGVPQQHQQHQQHQPAAFTPPVRQEPYAELLEGGPTPQTENFDGLFSDEDDLGGGPAPQTENFDDLFSDADLLQFCGAPETCEPYPEQHGPVSAQPQFQSAARQGGQLANGAPAYGAPQDLQVPLMGLGLQPPQQPPQQLRPLPGQPPFPDHHQVGPPPVPGEPPLHQDPPGPQVDSLPHQQQPPTLPGQQPPQLAALLQQGMSPPLPQLMVPPPSLQVQAVVPPSLPLQAAVPPPLPQAGVPLLAQGSRATLFGLSLGTFCEEVLKVLEGGRTAKTKWAPLEIGFKLLQLDQDLSAETPPQPGLESVFPELPEGESRFFISRGYLRPLSKDLGSGPKPKHLSGNAHVTMGYTRFCCVCKKTVSNDRRTRKSPSCKTQGHESWPLEVYYILYDEPPALTGYKEVKLCRGKVPGYVREEPGHIGVYIKPRDKAGGSGSPGGSGGEARLQLEAGQPAGAAPPVPVAAGTTGLAVAAAVGDGEGAELGAAAGAEVGMGEELEAEAGAAGKVNGGLPVPQQAQPLAEHEPLDAAAAAGAVAGPFTSLLLADDADTPVATEAQRCAQRPHNSSSRADDGAAAAATAVAACPEASTTAAPACLSPSDTASAAAITGDLPSPRAKQPRAEPPVWEASCRQLLSFLEVCPVFCAAHADAVTSASAAAPPPPHRGAVEVMLASWRGLLDSIGPTHLAAMRLPNGQGLAHWLATPPTHLYDERQAPPPTDPDVPLPEEVAVRMMQVAIEVVGPTRWHRLLEVQDKVCKATPLHRACRFGLRKRVLDLVLRHATRRSLILISDHAWAPYHTAFRAGHAHAGLAVLRRTQALAAELCTTAATDTDTDDDGDDDDDDDFDSSDLNVSSHPELRYGGLRSGGAEGAATGVVAGAGRGDSGVLATLVYSLPNQYFQGTDADGLPVPDVSPPFGHELLRQACTELGLGEPALLSKDPWQLLRRGKVLRGLAERARRLDRQEETRRGAAGEAGLPAAAAAVGPQEGAG